MNNISNASADKLKRRPKRKSALWYERGHWPYASDQHAVKKYAEWVKLVPWQLFCTFTFAWKVSDQQADKTFIEFINRLESSLKCNIAYVRGDEKRFSGCGKPACGRHFHALLTSEIPLHQTIVECSWKSMAGKRSDDAGAKAEPYDPHRGGALYVVKSINDINGDWSFRKLHLFHPEARSLQFSNARLRRSLRRKHARASVK
jgi:hypothetical protein